MDVRFDACVLDGGASIYDQTMHLRSAFPIDAHSVSIVKPIKFVGDTAVIPVPIGSYIFCRWKSNHGMVKMSIIS